MKTLYDTIIENMFKVSIRLVNRLNSMKDSTTLSIPIWIFVKTWHLGDVVLVKIVRRRKKNTVGLQTLSLKFWLLARETKIDCFIHT